MFATVHCAGVDFADNEVANAGKTAVVALVWVATCVGLEVFAIDLLAADVVPACSANEATITAACWVSSTTVSLDATDAVPAGVAATIVATTARGMSLLALSLEAFAPIAMLACSTRSSPVELITVAVASCLSCC